jgi:hypothetical protein
MMFRMDMSGILSGAMFSLITLFATAANASLVQKVETLPNNSKLFTIVDDVNHQQWLDVWSTIDQTHNQVAAKFLPGEVFEGYHVATTADLFTLFGAVGLAGELHYDQWGGLTASYFEPQRGALESFLKVMGFSIFDTNYLSYDNTDFNTSPILSINVYNSYFNSWDTHTVLYDRPKDALIHVGWGVSTLVVKDIASVPEPSGLMLALIALIGLMLQRRIKLR